MDDTTDKTRLLSQLLLSTNSSGFSMSPRNDPSKKFKTASTNVLPPCRVCGHPASGFHYGVNACEACKRFFRRSSRRKRHFKCRGLKQCRVQGLDRTLCGYCRYMRCLALGMSANNSKTGRYSHEKRAQDISEVLRLTLPNPQQNSLRMTEAEVETLVQTLSEGQRHMKTIEAWSVQEVEERILQKHEEFVLLQTLIGPRRLISLEEYSDVYDRTGMDVDGRRLKIETWMKSLESCIEGFVKFCKSIPGFSQLNLHDQTSLLKHSRVEVWFLGAYKGFNSELEIMHMPNGRCHHGSELSQVLGRDYVDCAFQLSDRLKNLEITVEETVVLKAICVMSADRVSLKEAGKVEYHHWSLVKALLHLFARKEKEEGREFGTFSKVVSCLMGLRHLSECSCRSLTNTLVADAVKDHPMLCELLVLG